MTYKFEHLNGGAEIVDPEIKWTFAGFYKDETGEVVGIQIDVLLITPSTRYKVSLKASGTASDRSDEAIDAICLQLLEQYKV